MTLAAFIILVAAGASVISLWIPYERLMLSPPPPRPFVMTPEIAEALRECDALCPGSEPIAPPLTPVAADILSGVARLQLAAQQANAANDAQWNAAQARGQQNALMGQQSAQMMAAAQRALALDGCPLEVHQLGRCYYMDYMQRRRQGYGVSWAEHLAAEKDETAQ